MAYNETPTKGPAMFKNREIRIKLAKTPQDEDAAPTLIERIHLDPEKIEEIGRKFIVNAAITIGAVIVAVKIIDIIGEIAVKKTKSADEE